MKTGSFKNNIKKALEGEIASIEHYYRGRKILKVMCADPDKLLAWARHNGVPDKWLHISRKGLSHFDLWGSVAKKILERGLYD